MLYRVLITRILCLLLLVLLIVMITNMIYYFSMHLFFCRVPIDTEALSNYVRARGYDERVLAVLLN